MLHQYCNGWALKYVKISNVPLMYIALGLLGEGFTTLLFIRTLCSGLSFITEIYLLFDNVA